ncbi:hypothetical protein M0812_21067 [Anaeramoeba flamelloides]|uniref:Uncharacterized protein n=1 Tax=Anaeramoeba flamelloides TaxID=1746091 RepID=A0AAV7YQS5_9EUKA|nr:hypothetical protein M0812_21067 [Anaeramoeba flamelloides]
MNKPRYKKKKQRQRKKTKTKKNPDFSNKPKLQKKKLNLVSRSLFDLTKYILNDRKTPLFTTNEIQCKEPYSLQFSKPSEILRNKPNAGGSSVFSEALSLEVLLKEIPKTKLLSTETEVEYSNPQSKITDYIISVNDKKNVAVSVSRAFEMKKKKKRSFSDKKNNSLHIKMVTLGENTNTNTNTNETTTTNNSTNTTTNTNNSTTTTTNTNNSTNTNTNTNETTTTNKKEKPTRKSQQKTKRKPTKNINKTTFTIEEAKRLLTKKLKGINESTSNVVTPPFERSILHIFTQKNLQPIIQGVWFNHINEKLKKNTILLLTTPSEINGIDWLFIPKGNKMRFSKNKKKRSKK